MAHIFVSYNRSDKSGVKKLIPLVLAVVGGIIWFALPPIIQPYARPSTDVAHNPRQAAFPPVARNADWTPVERDFDGVTMVLVPAGCFEMGSDNGGSDEQPVHEICFDQPFWIDRTEVTRAAYQQCVNAGVCDETPGSDFSTEDDQPINRVTWFQARTHCEWREGRLPTEAEWEYAARGPDRLIFPWGDEFDDTLANHCDSNCAGADWATDFRYTNPANDDGFEVSAPVGSFPGGASWVGALDMSGNLWEWTSSLYAPYPYEADHESDDDTSSARALRGGSFFDITDDLRSAYRYRYIPDRDIIGVGFRCARSHG